MRVVLTDVAYTDLLRIGAAIRVDNPRRAATFVAELYECCQSLSSMPRAFPLLPDWTDRGVRRRPYGNYLIFYRINGELIEILHVLHGARDYEAILFPDE